MAWAAWDANLDSYMATSFTECNNITIASKDGAICTLSRSKDAGPTPSAAEVTAVVNFLTTKKGDGLTFGGNKLMFTR